MAGEKNGMIQSWKARPCQGIWIVQVHIAAGDKHYLNYTFKRLYLCVENYI